MFHSLFAAPLTILRHLSDVMLKSGFQPMRIDCRPIGRYSLPLSMKNLHFRFESVSPVCQEHADTSSVLHFHCGSCSLQRLRYGQKQVPVVWYLRLLLERFFLVYDVSGGRGLLKPDQHDLKKSVVYMYCFGQTKKKLDILRNK